MKTSLDRRKFLKITSLSGAYIAIGCVPSVDGKEIPVKLDLDKDYSLNQFILIEQSGKIVLFNHRPEMGQGTFQSIPMIIAEELEVDINEVEIRQSVADRELYGSQMVVGSRSIQNEFEKCRIMGAAAREVLQKAAAKRWGITPESTEARNGKVYNSSNESFEYAELVESASELELPSRPKLKSTADFKVIGTDPPRRDIPLKTNGKAKFGLDMKTDNMLYASVERSKVFHGKVKSYNEKDVLKMPGVKFVFKTSREVYGRKREGVAVLAENYWQALQGRKALRVEWDNSGVDRHSTEDLLDKYQQDAKSGGDIIYGNDISDKIWESGSYKIIESSYITPYQSHVTMEPMNATVSVTDQGAEFWGSTQNPNGMRSQIARQAGISQDKVKINYTFMGGGFGRRSMSDVVEEATDLSIQSGRPVKVVWTREDDLTQGPFRAASFNVLKGALNESGDIVALEHKVSAQEIRNQTGNNNKAGRQLMGGINTDYKIPNFAVKGILQKHDVPISYWRAVYHSTNPFAHESFIDELATEAGVDPLKFRLKLLDNHFRFTPVLEKVAELTNWYGEKPEGTGRGVAICERSGAHFAMVIEVSRNNEKISIDKITTAVDVGICVHPDNVKAQTEGSIVMGLTAATKGAITLKGGSVEQSNFHDYKLLGIHECPQIETYIMKTDRKPDGAGESGLPTVAPALANAIFDLTGERFRELPIDWNSKN